MSLTMKRSVIIFQLLVLRLLPAWATRTRATSIVDKDLDEINRRFVNATPAEVLHWAADRFEGHIAQLTSFGVTGLVIADMLQRENLLAAVPQVTIDTLHLFPETEQFIADWRHEHKNATVKVFTPYFASNRTAFDENYGPNLRGADAVLFDYVSKVEPMRRALSEMHTQCWITGRRKTQGGDRAGLQIVERDPNDQTRIKVNPLAMWSFEDAMGYLRKNKVRYNPLIDRGFKSVGDVETTSATKEGEGERTGRWRGSSQTECGMHVSMDDASVEELQSADQSIRDGYKWEKEARKRCNKVGIKTCDEATLDTCVKGGALVLVYAPWCPHCQMYEPQFTSLATRLHAEMPRLSVVRLDGWENKPKGFNFDSFPTVFLVQPNGTKVLGPDDFHEMDIQKEIDWIQAQNATDVSQKNKLRGSALMLAQQSTKPVDDDYQH